MSVYQNNRYVVPRGMQVKSIWFTVVFLAKQRLIVRKMEAVSLQPAGDKYTVTSVEMLVDRLVFYFRVHIFASGLMEYEWSAYYFHVVAR